MINVFIPHRWNNDDYSEISALLDRTKFKVRVVLHLIALIGVIMLIHKLKDKYAMQVSWSALIGLQTIMVCLLKK